VQERSRDEVEWLAVVPEAAGDLAVVEEPRSWSERVAAVSEPGQGIWPVFARLASSRCNASTVLRLVDEQPDN
jgi:hypothetical protein